MIDTALARAAFQSRAESLVVATTGSTTLEATATGYARASGSFITDGFVIGMEVTPAGFTQTTPGIVTAVTALGLTINGGRTVQASGSGRTLTVGLPALRGYENTRLEPVTGRHYVSHEWVPGGSDRPPTTKSSSLETMPAQNGWFHEDGLSIWKWWSTPGVGTAASDKSIKALKALFTPGVSLSLADGTFVRPRGDMAVKSSQLVELDSWAVNTVTIPWVAWSRNVVTA